MGQPRQPASRPPAHRGDTMAANEVKHISLEDYTAVKPKFATYLPHTAGRYQAKRFRKAQCPIVERLGCSLMQHGRNNGKKLMAVRIVKHAMEIIALLTDQNPLRSLSASPGGHGRHRGGNR